MSFRQFDDPHSLPLKVLSFRILLLDPDAIIRVDKFTEDGAPARYISIESILSDDQLNQITSQAITPEETTAILRHTNARTIAANIPDCGHRGPRRKH